MNIYKHKPEKITSAKDLLAFVKGIPPETFCCFDRDNNKGQHCILGHLDKAYGTSPERTPTDGFEPVELVRANDASRQYGVVSWKERSSGKAIKARLIKFLTENLDRKS